MKFYKNSILAIFLAIATITFSYSQKIGYVNSQEIVALMPQVQEARSSLETFGQQMQKQAEKMYKSLEAKVVDLQTRQEELSPKQLEEERIKLQKEEMKLNEYQQNSQVELAKKEQELLSPILEQVQNAIDAVAEEGDYTYVFDSSVGVILYADDSTDISDKVKAKLGI